MDPKEKRKRVMTRSIKLGHCVCDPRKPCPCPLFKEKNVCTCAGERVPRETTDKKVSLTQFVRSAGCASKISQVDLHKVLGMLPKIEDPRLLVGTATADDAGVFELTDNVTVVQTVDVFTPGVDDPYLFGRIAACNSISDVYAMGGRPVTALSIIGFPIYSLPHDVMADILKGGMDVLKEAGAILLGGHSINDEEIKFGFAVTGIIIKDDMATNAGARPGDVLILSKPLGTGIVSLANQINKASPESVAAIEKSMSTLNRVSAEVMQRYKASACTDVTGFGILGHLCQMVCESGVTAEVNVDDLPLFPGVMEYAEQGMYSGANERNAEYSLERTEFVGEIPEPMKAILYDAQTSGGLLMAFDPAVVDDVITELKKGGADTAAVVGRILEKSDGKIRVRSGGAEKAPKKPVKVQDMNKEDNEVSAEKSCCAGGHGSSDGGALDKFRDFMGTATSPGALDVVTKELMAVALSLGVQCVPCSKFHIKKAMDMGIGAEELEEAASIAIIFGGCKTMMLWDDMKKEFLG